MSKYVWCEDSKSGYQFWKFIFGEIYPDMQVETQYGNSNLRKAVQKDTDNNNEYYVIVDFAVDNPDVLREIRKIKKDSANKNNVHIIQLHSFEFALLSFELLESWVFAEEDDLRIKRKEFLDIRESFVKLLSQECAADDLIRFKGLFDEFDNKSSEQIAARLLFEITRNTGFETDKSRLGNCFAVSCCGWTERETDDICGLDSHRIEKNDKANMIFEHSILKESFERVGL